MCDIKSLAPGSSQSDFIVDAFGLAPGPGRRGSFSVIFNQQFSAVPQGEVTLYVHKLLPTLKERRTSSSLQKLYPVFIFMFKP